MLTISELRKLRASLDAAAFEQQLGPFVVIQKPPDEAESAKARALGANSTAYVPKHERGLHQLATLLEFDKLQLATLPPVGRDDVLSVGRLPDNELVIDDVSVSKRHAELRWREGRCVVQDLGSTNGTYLNEKELGKAAVEVHDTDLVRFGKARFAFLLTSTLYRLMGAPSQEPRTQPYGVPSSAARAPELGPEPKTLLAPLDGKLAALAAEHRRKARAAEARRATSKRSTSATHEDGEDESPREPDEPTQISNVVHRSELEEDGEREVRTTQVPQLQLARTPQTAQAPSPDAFTAPVPMPPEAEQDEGQPRGEVTRRMLLRNPEQDVTVARPMFTAELAAELREEAAAEARHRRAKQRAKAEQRDKPSKPADVAVDHESAVEVEGRFDLPKKR